MDIRVAAARRGYSAEAATAETGCLRQERLRRVSQTKKIAARFSDKRRLRRGRGYLRARTLSTMAATAAASAGAPGAAASSPCHSTLRWRLFKCVARTSTHVVTWAVTKRPGTFKMPRSGPHSAWSGHLPKHPDPDRIPRGAGVSPNARVRTGRCPRGSQPRARAAPPHFRRRRPPRAQTSRSGPPAPSSRRRRTCVEPRKVRHASLIASRAFLSFLASTGRQKPPAQAPIVFVDAEQEPAAAPQERVAPQVSAVPARRSNSRGFAFPSRVRTRTTPAV